MKHMLYIRCERSIVHTNSSQLVSALNATVAVQRVRTRQSQSEETKEEPSVLVSQVLNPDIPPNQTGTIWEGLFFFKMKVLSVKMPSRQKKCFVFLLYIFHRKDQQSNQED